MKRQLFVSLALLAAGSMLLAQPVKAQDDYSKVRIVRLSFVEGTVQYQRPGQDWQEADLNLPIQQGFALRTAEGYAEVEFEDSLAVRMGTNSMMEFTALALMDGGRLTRLSVRNGTAIISAKLGHGDAVTVATANLTAKVPRDGRVRVDVSPEESWVTVFHGKIEVDSDSGTTSIVSGGHTLRDDANGSGSPEIARNAPQDEFDNWVSRRETGLNAARSETSGVLRFNSYTEGFADLYNYGEWSYLPGYGSGWMPYGVGAGWMPIVNGQWQFMGVTGWNWVSGEPWGWLPYHFGSRVDGPGMGWAWLPVGAARWMPATARWVQVNNQLGWIPNGPPQTSKSTKTQRAAVPATAILAAQDAGGPIRAGARTPLAQAGTNVWAAPAPPPRFGTQTRQSTQVITRTNDSAGAKAFVQAAPTSFGRGAGAPAFIQAPHASVARLSSIPQAMTAPHSVPTPSIARGTPTGEFRGGFGGARGGGSVGVMSAGPAGVAATSNTASLGSTTGVASSSRGAAGSPGGHH